MPENVGAWKTTVTSRSCHDRLSSAPARRERYLGAWLPEPITTRLDAAEQLELAKLISMAFMAERFIAESATGGIDGLLALLADAVVLHCDGGGKASAGLRPVFGPDRVVRYGQGVAEAAAQLHLAVRWPNGGAGPIAHRADGSVDTAFVLDVADGAVTRTNVIRNGGQPA